MDYSAVREFFKGEFDVKTLLQTVYGLNYVEMQTFEILLKVKRADVSQLMDELKRKDRVLVNRCLTTLRKNGLVKREKESIGGKRGYWYVYSVIDVGELKSNLIEKLDAWYKRALSEIENFEEFFLPKEEPVEEEIEDQSSS
ncbi:MAG: hypothetical protein D6732_06000 [Methanobacteriota archaeon]|nr:MAG: hypothetical protein D6732_06000 [Euryarchaeota archaeon]